jgi:hypothetical protein
LLSGLYSASRTSMAVVADPKKQKEKYGA